ncbi:hypothetical protein L6452_24676 [Arctium lappa]|uniref:Uncharacterized protein n=1 Tax=Arctium lappa TaxID=4217 RepID=A0ACB9A977_ARCLA|nr:hypothetical protein L6452_24676 [Arctium lappa]
MASDDWEHEEIFTDDDEAVGNDPEEREDLAPEIPAPPEIKQMWRSEKMNKGGGFCLNVVVGEGKEGGQFAGKGERRRVAGEAFLEAVQNIATDRAIPILHFFQISSFSPPLPYNHRSISREIVESLKKVCCLVAMISQFFVLSQRGDNIVFRDYRGDVQKGSAEIFFRKVKFWKEDGETEAPPVFNVDGVNYFHVKVVGLLFVATTRANVSPSLVLELLQRIARVTKDYLGILNEDSIRKNFVLMYELLDEVIDFGYVQTTSTEVLKSSVFNEPIMIDATHMPPLGPAALFMQGSKRMPGTAVTKSVVANEPGGRKREEIFVDIIEKISVTFSSSGYILTSEIDGTIQMKSYLSGNPEIRLALNEDLNIGRGGRSIYDYGGSSGSGAVILDDCNFHESVHLDSFDVDRTLTLVPPDGEFPVMNYRMTQEFKPPFRINTLIEEAGSLKAEVILKIRAEFPQNINANTVVVQMPLPPYTSRVSFELEPGAVGQVTDFKETNKKLEWGLKKIVGGSDHTLRAKLTFSHESHGNITKEAGPVSMTFTIPMYNCSRLQVKYLQIAKKSKTYNPYRWVRYVTQANSYVARI